MDEFLDDFVRENRDETEKQKPALHNITPSEENDEIPKFNNYNDTINNISNTFCKVKVQNAELVEEKRFSRTFSEDDICAKDVSDKIREI